MGRTYTDKSRLEVSHSDTPACARPTATAAGCIPASQTAWQTCPGRPARERLPGGASSRRLAAGAGGCPCPADPAGRHCPPELQGHGGPLSSGPCRPHCCIWLAHVQWGYGKGALLQASMACRTEQSSNAAGAEGVVSFGSPVIPGCLLRAAEHTKRHNRPGIQKASKLVWAGGGWVALSQCMDRAVLKSCRARNTFGLGVRKASKLVLAEGCWSPFGGTNQPHAASLLQATSHSGSHGLLVLCLAEPCDRRLQGLSHSSQL